MDTAKNDTLTPEQVCEILDISRPTLDRRIRDKEIVPLPRPAMLKRRRRLEFDRSYIESLAKP